MKKMILIVLLLFFAPAFAKQPEKIVLLLDWFANPNHAPIFVAQEYGFFKQHNVAVDIIGPADPSDPPKLVAAGRADIAITYQPHFMQQVDRGLPLIRIGTLIDSPLNCLVVLKEQNVKTLLDLKGKSVGCSTGEMSSLVLKTLLTHDHVALEDVERINVHYDLMQALLAKKVTAVTGMMRNFELIQLELLGRPARAFYPEQYGMPSYSELIFVAQLSKGHTEKFKQFMLAIKQGVDYLQTHPEETWHSFIKYHPELNNELNKRAWFATIKLFAKKPAQLNKKEWQAFAEFMLKNKLIRTIQPLDRYTI